MTILGISFAPLNVPLERRLQTLSIAVYVMLLMIGFFVFAPLFVYMAAFSKYWYIPMLYFMWMLYDRETPYKGGRRIPASKNFRIWSYIRDYFSLKLVKTAELPPEEHYIFGAFPHGIAAFGAITSIMSNANGFNRLFPGIEPRLVTLASHFQIPITRDAWLEIGGIDSSEKSIIHSLIQGPGSSILVFPGGMQEALYSKPGMDAILLRRRMGFIRVALKTGAHLIPVFSFGENECYHQITTTRIRWFQSVFKKVFGVPPMLISGRGFFQYTFGLLPHRKPITTVVGKPIPVPKVETPSKELIAEYHQKFEEAFISLFNEYKGQYHTNGDEAQLELV